MNENDALDPTLLDPAYQAELDAAAPPTNQGGAEGDVLAEQISQKVLAELAASRGGGNEPPAVPPTPPASPPSDALPDPEDDEVAIDFLRRTVVAAVEKAVGNKFAEIQTMDPGVGILAGEQVYNTISTRFKLSQPELVELRSLIEAVPPAKRAGILANETAQMNFASMARGRASFAAPPTPAPAQGASSGLTLAPGYTNADVQDYMKWHGIKALGPQHIKSLRDGGYIV